jgi:hypothetical protein
MARFCRKAQLLQIARRWTSGFLGYLSHGRRHGSDDVYRLGYDHLLQYSAQVKVPHPAMLKAISAGKKKNDRVDAQKISDLLQLLSGVSHSFARDS